MSSRKRFPPSTALKARAQPHHTQSEVAKLRQCAEIFAFLPDGVIACDREGKIRQINAAALKLFEVSSERQCLGRDCQEFLRRYVLCSEQQGSLSPEHGHMKPMPNEKTGSSPVETVVTLQVPSGRKIEMNETCSPLPGARGHTRGKVFIFHEISPRYKKALHLQRVHEAIVTLIKAITQLPEHIPEQVAHALPERSFLLSPPVIFIAQQLVDVIRRILDCQRVTLKALDSTGIYYYVTGSGFTAEREVPERATSGHITLSEIFEEEEIARLFANKEVLQRGDSMRILPGLEEFSTKSLLIIPLYIRTQLVGMLCIIKEGVDSVYTPEEIELVKAVATQAMLIVECLNYMHEQAEAHTRERMLNEVQHLSKDFLILASHELRTPLTGILGNLQLAQRRLEQLNRQVEAQARDISEHVERAQRPLASASQSARLQQRMINDIIDDARIQTNQLELHLERCNLLTLLNEVVDRQRRLMPERLIVFRSETAAQEVPVLADVERVIQVFTTYLKNALAYSPPIAPVTVQLTVEDQTARVSVRGEGPGIPLEEQEHIWDRFYRAKGRTVQHELDLSLGLGLYLCRALIERQHGNVGVQSMPGHGATFWFTLPMVSSAG